MKSKKSFSASILIIIISIFSSCKSTNNSNAKNLALEYLNIGDTYFKLEKYEDAAKYYNLALQDKENYWATYYKLANCYAFLSDWNNSLKMYKKILKRDENNSTLKANIAYIYAMKGDYHYASMIYEDLVNEQENNKDYLENYLAVILQDKKHFKDKKNTFDNLFKQLQENYPESSNINVLKTKYDELIEEYEIVSESESEDSDDETKSLEDILSEDIEIESDESSDNSNIQINE